MLCKERKHIFRCVFSESYYCNLIYYFKQEEWYKALYFEFGLDPKQDLFCKTDFTLLCSVLYLVQRLFQRKQVLKLAILIRVIIFFRYFLLILTRFGSIEVLGIWVRRLRNTGYRLLNVKFIFSCDTRFIESSSWAKPTNIYLTLEVPRISIITTKIKIK